MHKARLKEEKKRDKKKSVTRLDLSSRSIGLVQSLRMSNWMATLSLCVCVCLSQSLVCVWKGRRLVGGIDAYENIAFHSRWMMARAAKRIIKSIS